MTKSFIRLGAFAAAALFLAGCSTEELNTENPAGKNSISFAANAGAPLKATLVPTADPEVPFAGAWEDADKIGVFSLSGDSVVDDNIETTWSSESKVFSGNFSIEEGANADFIGIHPYSSTGDIDFGADRTQDGSAYNSLYDVMLSEKQNATVGTGRTIELPLDRQTAILYFHFTSDLEGETVQRATLTINGEEDQFIAGSYHYSEGKLETAGSSKAITLTFENGTNPSASDFTLWFNVLPCSFTSMSLTLETENMAKTISRSSAGSYLAGKLYEVEKSGLGWNQREKELTFDFSSNPGAWPTSSGSESGDYKYTLSEVGYNFNLSKNIKGIYCNSGYLMITEDERLGLPAIDGYRLASITAMNTGGCAADVQVSVTDNSSAVINGGEKKQWSTKGSSYSYTLTNNDANTVYYLTISEANCQLKSLTLTYKLAPKYSITCSGDISHGSITATPSSEAVEGRIISLTATPEAGYAFDGWDVRDASGNPISVENNKFTMPASNVTISASFAEVVWSRVTSVDDLTAGGTFIIGYEATANSGVIVPMQNTGTATISAAGYMYSGTADSGSDKGTIDMSSVKETSKYEVAIVGSTKVDGAVCIKIGSNYLGNENKENNCKLFKSEAKTTAFTPTFGENDVITLTIAANANYTTLQYNSGSPRFAVYAGTQKNVVIYKKGTK